MVSIRTFLTSEFLNPMRLIRRRLFPSYLGVDVGTTSIKIVEAKPGSQLPELVNYGLLESNGHLLRANKVLQTSSLKLFDKEVAELLKLLVRQMKTKTTDVVASLPSFCAFMTVLDFPKMQPKELDNAMTFQAKQYIPLPLSEVKIEWLKAGEYQDEKGFWHDQILLISTPLEQIAKYQSLFKLAGLHLRVLEVESLGLTRSLIAGDQTPTIIVDIGSRSTNIAFADKGHLTFNVQSDFASMSLTQALSSSLNLNPLRAEELKRERGITTAGPNEELSTVMLPVLDIIAGEVKRAYFNYQTQFPKGAKMQRLILSGGGANLFGIEKYFKDQFDVPTVKASSFFRFQYPSVIEPFVGELNPVFSVALGLALRQFL